MNTYSAARTIQKEARASAQGLRSVDFHEPPYAHSRYGVEDYLAERDAYRPPLIVLILAMIGAWGVVLGVGWLACHSGEFAAWVMAGMR